MAVSVGLSTRFGALRHGNDETLSLGSEVTVPFTGSGEISAGEDVMLVWEDSGSEQLVTSHTLTNVTDGEQIDSVSV